MLTFIVSISYAQYTPMTAAGYQFKRILCDSTLHIPSFCGVPTLRNSSAKNGAIALDTCNNLFYKWTNASGWTVINGVGNIVGINGLNGSDSIKLGGPLIENTIIYGNQNFNLYDLKTIDLAARGKGEVYIDSVLVGIGGNFLDLQTDSTNIPSSDTSYYKPLAIGSSQVVRRMNSWPKTDTTNKFVNSVIKINDSTIRVFKGNTITDLKILGRTDSTIYYTKYRSDTSRTNIYNAINTKLSKSDSTIFYTKYRSDTSRTNIYNAINQKLNITDTTNKWVNNVTKVNDSTIRVWKGTTSTIIELPRGSGGGGGTGTVYNVSTGYALSGGPINTTGTIIVDSAILSTKYLRRADTSNLVATKSNLALKLNIADTLGMLSKYLRKVDTLSLSNRINQRLLISDTTNKFVNNVTKKNDSTITVFKGTSATDITLPRGTSGGNGTVTNVATGYGLSGGPITSTGTIIVDSATLSSKYLRRADTSNLVATKSNLALKLNIADTTNKFVNNVTKINDTSFRVWKGTTSSVIAFAKDIVYTQSPIMSKVSNDSNIIYFNADTANAWRGGGSGTTPSLQDVATVGNFYANDFGDTLKINTYDGNNKHPILWTNDLFGSQPTNTLDFSYNSGANKNVAKIKFGEVNTSIGMGYIELTDENSVFKNEISSRTIYQNAYSPSGTTQTTYFPLMKDGTDTLATLEDVRNGGGSGTVTNISTGYGLSGGPITDTGTIIIDSATLSNKYLRIVDTTNKWINGSGTATRVPYWSANRTLTSSPNMVWNTSDSSLGVSNFYTGTPGSTQFDINSTATSLPISLGIWRRQINGAYTYFKEDEQGGAQHKWAFVGRFGFNQTRAFYQANSSIMNINLGWESPNSSNFDGSTLLINPKINITNALHTGTTIRGIYYNPTLTSLTNTKHIALQTTSGDIIFNNLKTSSSTTDSIAIFINDTLKKAPYPASATGFVPYTGATADVDLGAHLLSAQGLRVTGTNGAGDIHLRHQATDATATGQSTSLFADANGDLKYKNAGNFYTTLKTSNQTANRVYTYQNKSYTLADSADVAARVNYTDTASMLTPYLRSNIATATYLAKTDTASLSSRINLKVNIADTSSMLTPYIRLAGTGLTKSSQTLSNNLSTGVSGGQSVVGGTAASDSLTISSTTNATKGKIKFGTSVYFENTNNLGIGTSIDAGYKLDVNGSFRTSTLATTSSSTFGGTGTNVVIGSSGLSNYKSTSAGSNQFPALAIIGTSSSPTTGSTILIDRVTPGLLSFGISNGASQITRAGIQATSTNNTAGSENGDLTFLTQSGGTAMSEKVRITGAGGLTINSTNTASGTTGNQTINKASGTVNIAASGTTVTVTNSLVTATSIVYAVIRTNDATATIKNVVPAAGSFVINLGAAATAEVSIGFFVIN